MSTNLEARAWVRVRADALRQNYARVVEAVGPGVRLLPMVKADGYGLGVREVVRGLEPMDPWGFGIATVEEGVALRDMGVTRPIVVCGPVPGCEVETALGARLQLSVSSLDALRHIEVEARAASCVASIHVDVDTGLGRSGFDWRSAETWFPVVASAGEHVRWVGCYTHLHSADESRESVEAQWERLAGVFERLGPGPDGLMVHVLNSAGVFRIPALARTLVRPGIFLYGGGIGDGQPIPRMVVSLHARVVHTREVQAGSTVGYGATYAAERAERWATLSIGYGDGLPRSLGNRGSALLRGVRVPIIGRISMDVTVVDITDVPNVVEGDVATLFGGDGGEVTTVDEMASLAGTISYEILTGLTQRLPRVWSAQDV